MSDAVKAARDSDDVIDTSNKSAEGSDETGEAAAATSSKLDSSSHRQVCIGTSNDEMIRF